MTTDKGATQAIIDRLERLEKKLESRVIEGRALTLRYQDGNPMMLLVEAESGNVGLLLFGKDGSERAELHVTPLVCGTV